MELQTSFDVVQFSPIAGSFQFYPSVKIVLDGYVSWSSLAWRLGFGASLHPHVSTLCMRTALGFF